MLSHVAMSTTTTTMAMNIGSLNGPPHDLQLQDIFTSNSSNHTTDNFDGVGNHLNDFYKFLRQSEWTSTVLPITVFLSVLMVLGIVGNGLVIAVFFHNASTSRVGDSGSGLLVVSLAVADLMVCVLAMPGQIVRAWYLPWHHDALCKAWELLRHAALPISAVILVAIAHDRYRLICRPMSKVSAWRSRMTFKAVMVVACVMGVVFGVPPMLAVGVNQRVQGGGGEVYYLGLCEVNGLIMSNTAMKVYWDILVCFFIVVLLCLVVTYSAILLSVWRHASSWKRRTKITPQVSASQTTPSTTAKPPRFAFWRRQGQRGGSITKCDEIDAKLESISEQIENIPNMELNLYPIVSAACSRAEPEYSSWSKLKKESASKYCDSKPSGDADNDFYGVEHVDEIERLFRCDEKDLATSSGSQQKWDEIAHQATAAGKQDSPTTHHSTHEAWGETSDQINTETMPKSMTDSNLQQRRRTNLPNKDDPQPFQRPHHPLSSLPSVPVATSQCQTPHSRYRPKEQQMPSHPPSHTTTKSMSKSPDSDIENLSLNIPNFCQQQYAAQPLPPHRASKMPVSPLNQSDDAKAESLSYRQEEANHSHPTSTKPKASTSDSTDRDNRSAEQVPETVSQVRKPQYRAHVKTAAIFFLVTLTFLASYLPTFLMIVGVVPVHPVLYYSYLIHAAVNPLLYSAANKKFRSSAKRLFACKRFVQALRNDTVFCFR